MAQSYNYQTATWTGGPELEVDGAGLSWVSAGGTVKLAYRVGNRVWTNGDFDVDQGRSYKIAGVPVLSSTQLGPSVTSSSLQEVGALVNLDVLGDASIGDFAFFSAGSRRFGINTTTPFAALDILDSNVNIILGSQGVNSASIGTYTNSDLNIITDDTPRITIKNTGDVTIAANVTINGTLNVASVVTDNRVDRYNSLTFMEGSGTTIYGLGLEWVGQTRTRKLVMLGSPDRLSTTESFDIGPDATYYINGTAVLSSNTLGSTVVYSNLTSLGTLSQLNVSGPSNFQNSINAGANSISAGSLKLATATDYLNLSVGTIDAGSGIKLTVSSDSVFAASLTGITLGNNTKPARPVSIYGPVGVGVNTPDPTLSMTIAGDISVNGKKFVQGTSSPTAGSFNVGDICWNTLPNTGNFIGWVCVVAGGPGEWRPFGAVV